MYTWHFQVAGTSPCEKLGDFNQGVLKLAGIKHVVLKNGPFLVGGLEHFLFFPYFGKNHPNWLIFFRRGETTNQISFGDFQKKTIYRGFSSAMFDEQRVAIKVWCQFQGVYHTPGLCDWNVHLFAPCPLFLVPTRGCSTEEATVPSGNLLRNYWTWP